MGDTRGFRVFWSSLIQQKCSVVSNDFWSGKEKEEQLLYSVICHLPGPSQRYDLRFVYKWLTNSSVHLLRKARWDGSRWLFTFDSTSTLLTGGRVVTLVSRGFSTITESWSYICVSTFWEKVTVAKSVSGTEIPVGNLREVLGRLLFDILSRLVLTESNNELLGGLQRTI